MNTISIVTDGSQGGVGKYRAVLGDLHSEGKTPGEALDALTSQMENNDTSMLVMLQQIGPDQFFTAEQQKRLEELMQRWRSARDSGSSLPKHEQDELEALTQSELSATKERAAALARKLSS